MIFFIAVLLISLVIGIYILLEDSKNNKILESIAILDEDTPKINNLSHLGKNITNSNIYKSDENLNEDEKKLLHISRLI